MCVLLPQACQRSWSKPERSVRGAGASQGLGEGRADSHTDPGKVMVEEETRCRRGTPSEGIHRGQRKCFKSQMPTEIT